MASNEEENIIEGWKGNDYDEFHFGIMNSRIGSHRGYEKNLRATFKPRSVSATSDQCASFSEPKNRIFEMSEETTAKKREFNWIKVLWYIHLHALAIYGIILLITQAKWLTVFFTFFVIFCANLGMTLGAHRFWAHSAFQVHGIVKFFFMIFQTMAGVGSIYDWVLAHRIHHKYYGTDYDPYNHNKGFIYSHLFANLLTPHPDEEKIVQSIDMRDIEADGWVWFQRGFYWPLFIIVGLLLPINAPTEYWGESLMNSFFILGFFRLAVNVHLSWLINSGFLIWGLKPGDKYPPNDNTVFFISKSHWPRYHYLLSWDYKSGEYGNYDSGCSTIVLHFLSSIGSVKLMKTASTEAIREALHECTKSKNSTVDEALEGVKKIAEQEAAKIELSYCH